MKKKTSRIKWLLEPEKQDFPSALLYLSLIFKETEAKLFVNKLKKTTVIFYKAKDLFRASTLSLLGASNYHKKKDIKKINNEVSLSPLLLVRNSANGKVIIADGYHRLCAVYSIDEDALIPCKIV